MLRHKFLNFKKNHQMRKDVVKVNQTLTIVHHDESSPFSLTKIVKAEGGNQYYVISELKNSEDCTFKVMRNVELIDYFELSGHELPNALADICITKNEILNHPNDADLGNYIRKKIF
jgi:hypothetical protein